MAIGKEMNKIYKRRDSATSVLRGLGIGKSEYSEFITKQSDGTYLCDIMKAREYITKMKHGLTPIVKGSGERVVKSVAVAVKPGGEIGNVSIAKVCRDLIKKGYSNVEVWETIKTLFPDEDHKKRRHYPSWYRSQMKRDGLL